MNALGLCASALKSSAPADVQQRMTRLFVCALFVLLAGCPLADAFVTQEVEPFRTSTILADEATVSPKCIERMYDAAAWWNETLGLPMFRVVVVAKLDTYGASRRGDVRFHEDDSLGSRAYTDTIQWQNHRLYSARVRLRDGDSCSVPLLAHELGHALTLPHRDEDGALMNGSPRAMGVNAAELARVEAKL